MCTGVFIVRGDLPQTTCYGHYLISSHLSSARLAKVVVVSSATQKSFLSYPSFYWSDNVVPPKIWSRFVCR